jgi:hypothetical protein
LLRQVVLATDDIEGAGKLIRDRFSLRNGFADPELATVGLSDDTMALAGGSYLELVSPLSGEPIGAALSRWLAKTGGGGYVLSVQHSDAEAARDRAVGLGVRLAAGQLVMGHRIVQFTRQTPASCWNSTASPTGTRGSGTAWASTLLRPPWSTTS